MFGGQRVFNFLITLLLSTTATAGPSQFLKGTIVYTQWQMSSWSCCDGENFSSTGVTSSTPYCQRTDGVIMGNEDCPGSTPSNSTQSCSSKFCSGYTYSVGFLQSPPSASTMCFSGSQSNTTSLFGWLLGFGSSAYTCN